MDEKRVELKDSDVFQIANMLLTDLRARIEQDPIALSAEWVFLSNAFKAILNYRVTNWLYYNEAAGEKTARQLVAYKMAEECAAKTSIEIHPAAVIGKSFVIDHGINTLIGATTTIGDHCTILQNVVLGARKITNNRGEKRHPTIGHHVQIAGGVRVFGTITVGNYVTIGPDCVITRNVPDHTCVKLVKSLQETVVSKEDWFQQ